NATMVVNAAVTQISEAPCRVRRNIVVLLLMKNPVPPARSMDPVPRLLDPLFLRRPAVASVGQRLVVVPLVRIRRRPQRLADDLPERVGVVHGDGAERRVERAVKRLGVGEADGV